MSGTMSPGPRAGAAPSTPSESLDADVLVVGAGPAGASTARRLAGAGIDVLLLDASSFPRSKPCGDCLSPGATPLLRELGVLERLERRGPGRLAGWRIRTPAGAWFGGRFGGSGPEARPVPRRGLSLPRRELDAALVEAAVEAGARLRERVRVFGLLRRGGRVRGVRARDDAGEDTLLRARVVVGADGLRSTVARRLAGVRRGPRDRLAVVGRFRGVEPCRGGPGADPASGALPAGEMRLSREGMLGLAPTGAGRWNATLVLPRDRAPRLAPDPAGLFRRRLEDYGVADRFRDAERVGELEITGPFEVVPRRATAPGALLVGDAAGYFDPLTGQGIHRALATGRAAAKAVRTILAAAGPAAAASARLRYEGELHRLLDPGRRVQRLVDAVVSRPWLMEPVGQTLAARSGLASLLVDVAGDRLPPTELVAPRRLARAWGAPPASFAGAG